MDRVFNGPPSGREAELADLAARVEAALLGQPGAVLVVAAPGLGRTSVLREAAARAAGRLRVLFASGSAMERDFPFGVVRQLFEPLLADTDPAEHEDLFRGPARLAVPALAPDLLQHHPSGWVRPPIPVLHGLHCLTANLAARRPLLLAVDDLQWADRESLQWLTYLSRRLGRLPVMVLGTLGCGRQLAAPELIDQVHTVPQITVLKLAPLTVAAVAELAGRVFDGPPDPAFSRACHLHSGGNPRVLRTLLAGLREHGGRPSAAAAAAVPRYADQAVAELTAAVLRDEPAETEAVAQAVAALGEGADQSRVAALADVDGERAADAVARLRTLGLVDHTAQPRFRHPRAPGVILAGLPEDRRRELCRQAARLLEAAGAPAEQVAGTLLRTTPGGEAWVAERLYEAAARATSRGAPRLAVEYLQRAWAEPPADDLTLPVLVRLGSTEAVLNPRRAVRRLNAALDRLDDAGRWRPLGPQLADAFLYLGRADEAAQVLDRLWDPGAGTGEDSPALRAQGLLLTLESGPPPALVRPAGRRIPGAAGPGEPAMAAVHALAAAGDCAGRLDAVRSARTALAGGLIDRGGLQPGAAAVLALTFADQLDEARYWSDQLVTAALRCTSPPLWAVAAALRAEAGYRAGALAAAVADARAVLDLAPPDSGGRALPLVAGTLVRALVDSDRLAEASGLAGLYTRAGGEDSWQRNQFLEARAWLRLAQRDFRGCVQDAHECGRRQAVWRRDHPGVTAWRSAAARASLALGDVPAARRLAAEELSLARAWGGPRAVGIALRTQAAVADSPGEPLAEAVQTLLASPAPLELARVLADLGTVQLTAGQRRTARQTLQQAVELAQSCGAAAVARRAHRRLVEAGARPRRIQTRGVGALTRSERRVVEMAAAGQTNWEIAGALFVTQRTVELHLSRAYRKLGVAGRSELSRALDRPSTALRA